jgi:hypothetical protein
MLHEKPGETTINNVAYVPNLAANLLSVNILAKRGLTTIFSEKGCYIYKNKVLKLMVCVICLVNKTKFTTTTFELQLYCRTWKSSRC